MRTTTIVLIIAYLKAGSHDVCLAEYDFTKSTIVTNPMRMFIEESDKRAKKKDVKNTEFSFLTCVHFVYTFNIDIYFLGFLNLKYLIITELNFFKKKKKNGLTMKF
jgi:hypothetical protein